MKENRTKVIRARLSEEEKEQVFRRAKAGSKMVEPKKENKILTS
jgi:hypothetical protein